METAKVPLFKLFVYSVVDVKDEFEEVNGLKMLFYFVLAWSFSLEAIFVLNLTFVTNTNVYSIACPHYWRLFWRRQYLNEFFFP